jgi:uncharacterized protein YjbJ (UPF0337 family)
MGARPQISLRGWGYFSLARRETSKEDDVSEKSDEIKGRAKEAGGDLTGDDDLKNEGKVDQAKSTVKEKLDDAGDKVKDAVGRD